MDYGKDLLALTPFFVGVAAAVLVVLVDAFHRTEKPRTYVAYLAFIGLGLVGIAAMAVGLWLPPTEAFGGMYYHDRFTSFLTVLFSIGAMVTVAVSPKYLRENSAERGEYYALIILAVTGMILMAGAGDLIMIFLGIEVMSVSVYVLVGFFRYSGKAAEASMKYFFLGAFASAVFLYGAALVFGATGSTGLEAIGAAVQSATQDGTGTIVHLLNGGGQELDPLFSIGMMLILVGLGFKIALVPFHMWTPDAYEGAPASSVAFMATAVKAAGFAALLRLAFTAFGPEVARIDTGGWVQILFYLSLLTVIVGNVLAIVQDNLQRMLAYSSIAHAGYALIGLVGAGAMTGVVDADQTMVLGHLGSASVLFYLLAYTFATAGAFGVLAYLGSKRAEVKTYDDLNGLGYKYPAMGAFMVIFMLSSAGIPPTAGFVGKFYVFQTAVTASGEVGNNSFLYLVIAAVLASLAGAYYYLRVIVRLYMAPAKRETPALQSYFAKWVLAGCAAATIIAGVLPSVFMKASRSAAASMSDVGVSYDFSDVSVIATRPPRGYNPVKPDKDEKNQGEADTAPEGEAKAGGE